MNKNMKMVKCEDHDFMVKSSDEKEVMSMGAMHIISMHPEKRVSMKDIKSMIEPAM